MLAASPEDQAWWEACSAGECNPLLSDTVVTMADGRQLHVSRSIRPVGNGHALVMLRDRSTEYRAERERELLLAELQATLESTADGILVCDLDGHIRAFNRLFAQWPDASVLWAHSGFEQPAAIREQLLRHPRLWCDLAYRNEHAGVQGVEPAWRELFAEFPDRFMVGTDTFTPERWHYIGPHATSARRWLASLPPGLAEQIAWRNAHSLLRARPPR
jgi:hypothetical protein